MRVKRVMIVDDHPVIGKVLRDMFEKEKYEVEVFLDAEAALGRLLCGPKYSLVITDIMMPKVDGNLFRGIVKRKFKDTGVITMSGSSEKLAHVEGHKIGKPFCQKDIMDLAVQAVNDTKNSKE